MLILTVDGGPDWSTNSLVNALFYMRLWRDNNLDVLVATSFAACFSAFNPIEHLWSPLSKKLDGVTSSAVAPGDSSLPPKPKESVMKREARKKQRSLTEQSTNYARRTGRMLLLMAIQFSGGSFPVFQVVVVSMMTIMLLTSSFEHQYEILNHQKNRNSAKSSDS